MRRNRLLVLPRYNPGRDLLDLVAIKQDLEDLLGLHVDVVSSAGLSPYLRESVIRGAVPLSWTAS
jgi:predicted nucleotidyltransferase